MIESKNFFLFYSKFFNLILINLNEQQLLFSWKIILNENFNKKSKISSSLVFKQIILAKSSFIFSTINFGNAILSTAYNWHEMIILTNNITKKLNSKFAFKQLLKVYKIFITFLNINRKKMELISKFINYLN